MKIKWKVSPKPTGPYSSFQTRCWPSAVDENGNAVAHLTCDDEYTANLARGGLNWHDKQPTIYVKIANWSNWNLGEARNENKAGFIWMTLKQTFTNVADAKVAVKRYLDNHPDWFNKIDVKK